MGERPGRHDATRHVATGHGWLDVRVRLRAAVSGWLAGMEAP